MSDKPAKPPRKRQVRDAINAAPAAAISPDALPGANVPSHLTKNFEMTPGGLLHKKGEDSRACWICSAFEIVAETLDEETQTWGLLLTWPDRNGARRSQVFNRDLFCNGCTELRGQLARGGLTMNGSPAAQQSLAEYLCLAHSPARAHCVGKIGWHHIDGELVYVLPGEEVFGRAAQRVVLQTPARDASPHGVSGTLDGWRDGVGGMCIGNTRLVFAVSAAFAAPLLEITGAGGIGFHMRGKAQTGKTTVLRVASSVWGGAPGQGAEAYVRTWRATGNGLESIASAHNDSLLVLDEIGEVDAREIGEICYMLANGQGKSRADRTGGLRPQLRWRVLFLSSGEVGLADKNAEAGLQTRAGQEVRLIDLPADAGAATGIFEELHGTSSPGEFIEGLRAATRLHYGTPGRAFLRHLFAWLQRDAEAPAKLRERIDVMATRLLSKHPAAGAQVRSVARRFALVAIAGELATEATLITGWTRDEAAIAAQALFDAWLADRGTEGAREDEQAVVQLRNFISRHGSSRFVKWHDAKDEVPPGQMPDDPEKTPPPERSYQRDTAGWRLWRFDEERKRGWWRYVLTKEAMHEALRGLDFRAACSALVARGYLLPDSEGKSTRSMRPPGLKTNVRVYEVCSTIIGAATQDIAGDGDDAED